MSASFVTSGLKEVPMAASPSEENNTALAVNTAQKVSWKPQLTTIKYLVPDIPPIPLESFQLLQPVKEQKQKQLQLSKEHGKWKPSETPRNKTLRNKTTHADAWKPIKGPSDSVKGHNVSSDSVKGHNVSSDSVKGHSDSEELKDPWTLVTHSRNSTKSLHSGSKYTQKSYKNNSSTRNMYNVQDLANDPEGNLAMPLNH